MQYTNITSIDKDKLAKLTEQTRKLRKLSFDISDGPLELTGRLHKNIIALVEALKGACNDDFDPPTPKELNQLHWLADDVKTDLLRLLELEHEESHLLSIWAGAKHRINEISSLDVGSSNIYLDWPLKSEAARVQSLYHRN